MQPRHVTQHPTPADFDDVDDNVTTTRAALAKLAAEANEDGTAMAITEFPEATR